MAIAFVKNGGTNGAKTTGSTATVTVPAGGHAVGNTVVLVMGFTNSGTTASGYNVTDSGGNTWTAIESTLAGGTAVSVHIFASVLTTALAAGSTISFNTNSGVFGQPWGLTSIEFSGLALTTDVAGVGANYTTTAVSAGPITPPTAGSLVLGAFMQQGPNNDTFTEDTDTAGGTAWASGPIGGNTPGGSATSNATTRVAYKIQASSAAQTYNPTVGTGRTGRVRIGALKAAATGTAWTATPADTLTVADAIASFGQGEGVADALSVADAQANTETKVIFPSDAAAVADAQAFDRTQQAADTLTVADADSESIGRTTSPADTLTVADGVSQQTGKEIVPADAATVADGQSFGFGPSAADSATAADGQSFGFGPSAADSATAADGQSFSQGEGVADALSIADAQALSRDVQQQITDTLTVADAQALSRGVQQLVTDALSVADAASPGGALNVTPADALTVADALSTAQSFNVTPGDLLALADALVAARGVSQALADTLVVADVVWFDRQQAISDAVALADQQSRGIGTNQVDVLALVDSTISSLGIARQIADAVAATDTVVTFVPGGLAPYTHTEMPQGGTQLSGQPLGGTTVPIAADGTQLSGQAQSGTTVIIVAGANIVVYEASGLPRPYAAAGGSV